jgi:LmbE family N-acetylglucosaminyl deacetylase
LVILRDVEKATMKTYQHIYLSPHYDDASLSCGGTIYRQTQLDERVLVVTICAAPPNPSDPFSPFAQDMHAIWGNPQDVITTRRMEDRRSMEMLGADFLYLDFPDCIYRGDPHRGRWYYNNDIELFGLVHPDDLPLKDKIIAGILDNVSSVEKAILYAPLTVGYHVDHQLVHTAAQQMQAQGWTVVFYEDYPYADPNYSPHGTDNPSDLDTTLTRLQSLNLKPQHHFFSEENLQAKIESVAAYASQLEMLFGRRETMVKMIREYALKVGDGRPAERVWVSHLR